MPKPIISEEKLLNLLPHGSGIDFEWQIHTFKNVNMLAKNAFHAMNEYGYYDGIMPFSIHLYRHKSDCFHPLHGALQGKFQCLHRKSDIAFTLSCDESRRNSFFGLYDYLYDTISYSLESVLTHRNEILP